MNSKRVILLGILILGLAEFGYGAWIPAKAWLSQVLLAHAWQQTLQQGAVHKPWSWADTWPVLELRHEASDKRLLVLQGDSGQALAFGPGLTGVSSMPGQAGNTIISGHRDTHFSFLRHVRVGDIFVLQDAHSQSHRYRLESIDIVDASNARLIINTSDDRLTLVTCYPFNEITEQADSRYVATAIRVSDNNS